MRFARRRRRADAGLAPTATSAERPVDAMRPLLVNMIEGRSGTTLLMQLLDRPEVAFDREFPYENRYLAYLARVLTPSGEPYVDSPEWNTAKMLRGDPRLTGPFPFNPTSLEVRDIRARLVRHSWRALAESLTASATVPPRYYAEKAWGSTLDLLTEAGVPVSIINLVRDPRDVVCSIRAFDFKRQHSGFGRGEAMTDREYLDMLLDGMAGHLATMAVADPLRRSTLVRYEDMVADRAAVLRALGEFLGLEMKDDPGVGDEETYLAHRTSPDPASSIGRWKHDLPADDVAVIEDRLGAEMRRYGYLAPD